MKLFRKGAAQVGLFTGLCLFSGCADIRIHHTSSPFVPLAEPVPARYTTILLGFKTVSEAVNLSEVCPSGWEILRSRETFVQSVLRIASFNFYDPWTVEVSCRIKPKLAPA